MVALPLLDLVLASEQGSERSARVAVRLLNSALAELQQIEALDASSAPENPEEFDRSTASLLRGMYERWADETEQLLDRVDRLQKSTSATIPGADQIRRAHGRTRARLSISLDDMERGVREAAQGDTVPIEEVRRDLRLRIEQAGKGAIPTTRPVAGRRDS